MKILFMGTPEFSEIVLRALCENGHSPAAVVTRADKPAGRGNVLSSSPVKKYALSRGIEVLQPEKLSDPQFSERLAALLPDIIIVVAYGRILPEYVLSLPKYGCINAHASLLPEYRGAAPMQRAIMDGKNETGVTIMKMDKGLDTGDTLLALKTPISDTDTLETIHDRLAELSCAGLEQALELIEKGKAVFTPQNDNKATYAEKIRRADEIIDFRRSADELSCQLRALTPFPYAFCTFNGKAVKITKALALKNTSLNETKAPGEVVSVKNGVITVACGSGALEIYEVFPENKRRMSAADFVNGARIKPGDIFLSGTEK